MRTTVIIKEICRLPLNKRILIIEKTIHSIRQQQESKQLEFAVNELLGDYVNDSNLTEFTNIDFEDFYETR